MHCMKIRLESSIGNLLVLRNFSTNTFLEFYPIDILQEERLCWRSKIFQIRQWRQLSRNRLRRN